MFEASKVSRPTNIEMSGLPLKARTKPDYLAMIEPGRTSTAGKQFADGELYPIAEKLLPKLRLNAGGGFDEVSHGLPCRPQLRLALADAVAQRDIASGRVVPLG